MLESLAWLAFAPQSSSRQVEMRLPGSMSSSPEPVQREPSLQVPFRQKPSSPGPSSPADSRRSAYWRSLTCVHVPVGQFASVQEQEDGKPCRLAYRRTPSVPFVTHVTRVRVAKFLVRWSQASTMTGTIIGLRR